MIIDNTAGFQFFLNEDIYLIKSDTGNLDQIQPETAFAITTAEAVTEQPVIAQPEPAVVVETHVLRFNYIGKNQKHFLILCNYTEAMDEKHLAALTSTLQRKELTLDDVAILNLALYTNATVEQIGSYFNPRRLLLLGEACLLSGWDKFELNRLTDFDGVKSLYTYSFNAMMGNRDKTKVFWEQMKVL